MANELMVSVDGLQADYQRDGVVIVRGALNEHWLNVLREAIDIQVAKGIRYFANRNMRTEPGGFQDFCLHSGIGKIVADIAGSPFASLIFDQMFVKEAGTRTKTGWHTDQPYWPIDGPIMTTWIALDTVNAENGALEFIAGSHDWGMKYRPFLTDELGAFKNYVKVDDPQYSDMPDLRPSGTGTGLWVGIWNPATYWLLTVLSSIPPAATKHQLTAGVDMRCDLQPREPCTNPTRAWRHGWKTNLCHRVTDLPVGNFPWFTNAP